MQHSKPVKRKREYPKLFNPLLTCERLILQTGFSAICLHTSSRFDHREHRIEFSMRAVRSSENVTNMPVKTKQNRTDVVKWESFERSENLQHGQQPCYSFSRIPSILWVASTEMNENNPFWIHRFFPQRKIQIIWILVKKRSLSEHRTNRSKH